MSVRAIAAAIPRTYRRNRVAVVIENYATSDRHGHDYYRYLAHGEAAGRAAVVVLLCQRREMHMQRDGWESAVIVTYSEVLGDVESHIARSPSWSSRYPDQYFFIFRLFNTLWKVHRQRTSTTRLSAVDPRRLGDRNGHLGFDEFRTVGAAIRLAINL